jgi:hypothetical protein
MADSAATTPVSGGQQLVNGTKFVGDVALMPGLSQMVEGRVGTGLVYGITGILARSAFGPLGWLMTGLDSYSVSSTGKHLWELFPGRPQENIATGTVPVAQTEVEAYSPTSAARTRRRKLDEGDAPPGKR